MRVVVDANIVISALLGSKVTVGLMLSDDHELYSPKVIIAEISKHKEELCQKAGYSLKEFDSILNALLKFIKTVDYGFYEEFMDDAVKAIGERDIKDADYIACASSLGAEFIWTNDKDFRSQELIPVKTTKELMG